MAIGKFVLAAAVAATVGFSANAATLYKCRDPGATDPAHSTLFALIVLDNGEAYAQDAWANNVKAGGGKDDWMQVKIRRNDASVLDAGWTTKRLKSNASTYNKLNFKLQLKKADMSYYLGMSGSEAVSQNYRGKCEKSTVKG